MPVFREFFRHLSIRHKLLAIIVVSLLITTTVASIAFIIYDRHHAEKQLAEQVGLIAQITGMRSSAALAFGDKIAMNANLEALATLPGFISACTYDSDLNPYVELQNSASSYALCPVLTADKMADDIRYRYLEVIRPIKRNQTVYGHIYMRYSLDEVIARTWIFSLVALLISLGSIGLALIFSRRLQGAFIYPIISLNAIADLVAQSEDYSVRAPVHSDDEIGNLVRSFNSMLNLIQQKHINLIEAITELQQTSENLKQFAKSAEEKGEEFQQLLASAAHDLRQPLQAMAIFVDALKSTASKDQAQLVRKLDIAIDNMSQLFSDLLDYSRLQNRAHQHIVESPVELKQLLRRVSHEFDAIASDKNLSVRFRADNIKVQSHETTLERIVRNLLSNALRYTETGGVLITCRYRDGHVVIEVYDTGIGIKAESMDKIFQSYVQEENRSDAQKQGVGLGLSIVTRLIDLMGFKLEVKSRVGRGSLFRIHIPAGKLLDAPLVMAPETGLTLDSPLTRQQVLAERVVCVLDDDPAILDQLETLLINWGAQVYSAASLDALRDQLNDLKIDPPDVIVSDYQLGVVDTGIDAVDLIRVTCNEPIPALIVTGIEDEAELQILRNQGYSVLRKPVKPAKMRAMLSFMLNPDS